MRHLNLIAFALLAGCATSARPPSLAPRAVEQASQEEPPASPVATPSADPALSARIARLLTDAREGDTAFEAANVSGRTALARLATAAQGSEAWIEGQQIVSALEAARQRSAAALAELDSLLIERASLAAGNPKAGGLAELGAVQAEIQAIVERQTARIESLTR